MDNKTKEYDMRNKTAEETINMYNEITDDLEVQKMIWEKTHNYEVAKSLYEKYLKDKENRNEQKVSK